MNMAHILTGHGAWPYLVTFAWTFVEGESFVLLAGFAAAQGMLNPPLLLLAAWLGSFCGDQCYFWIGRTFGARVLARRPRWRARVDRVLTFLRRYNVGFILTFRFIYGVRNFSSFAIGISGVGWLRFLLLNLVAALIWAVTFVGAGFLSGRVMHRALGDYAQQFSIAMLAVLAAILFSVWVFYRVKRYRTDARQPQIDATAAPKIDA
jgi:membrane protein DedA with SNARE-associated domain